MAIGFGAAAWAMSSVVRAPPRRAPADPPGPPAIADFTDTVAAVGLIEASTENIRVGTPLAGVVEKVFVTAGQTVRRGQPLFELDTRQLRAELAVRQRAVLAAGARVPVAEARVADVQRQLEFAEQVKDKRAISAEELARRRSAVETASAELDEVRSQVPAAESQVES